MDTVRGHWVFRDGVFLYAMCMLPWVETTFWIHVYVLGTIFSSPPPPHVVIDTLDQSNEPQGSS